MDRKLNRRVLVSVFNPQEAREAVLGGARILDSEDPRSALGNIKPRQIMDISDAVLNFKRDLEVQLSTNIGEDQLLFRRTESGMAIEKTPYEIAGKASQAALGVALSMGTKVHPCAIVKVGLDAMPIELLESVLSECVVTLRRCEHFSRTRVMSVLFVQDLDLWDERKKLKPVREGLVSLREFYSKEKGEDVFDLSDYAVNTLRDPLGMPLFISRDQVTLAALIDKGVLPPGTKTTNVALNELYPHNRFGWSSDPKARRTNKEVIAKMVDATADAGADGIMLDTSVLLKVAEIGLLSTAGSKELIDFNRFDVDANGLERKGVLDLDEIEFFIEYCHYKGVEAYLAGSIQSYQAQQIWRVLPNADQLSARGGASAVRVDPSAENSPGQNTRRDRVIVRQLVSGFVPPEQGGYVFFPVQMKGNKEAKLAIKQLLEKYKDLQGYWADLEGNLQAIAQR